MNAITPRQRDADYLVMALWRARVHMNQVRRARAKQKPVTNDIPPLLRETLRRA